MILAFVAYIAWTYYQTIQSCEIDEIDEKSDFTLDDSQGADRQEYTKNDSKSREKGGKMNSSLQDGSVIRAWSL